MIAAVECFIPERPDDGASGVFESQPAEQLGPSKLPPTRDYPMSTGWRHGKLAPAGLIRPIHPIRALRAKSWPAQGGSNP